MSGYRQHNFDPLYTPPRKLLRPFDRWQWLGAALAVAGFALLLVEIFDPFGGYNPQHEGVLTLAGAALLWWRDPDLPAGTLGQVRGIILLLLFAGIAFSFAPSLF